MSISNDGYMYWIYSNNKSRSHILLDIYYEYFIASIVEIVIASLMYVLLVHPKNCYENSSLFLPQNTGLFEKFLLCGQEIERSNLNARKLR